MTKQMPTTTEELNTILETNAHRFLKDKAPKVTKVKRVQQEGQCVQVYFEFWNGTKGEGAFFYDGTNKAGHDIWAICYGPITYHVTREN